MGNAVRCGERDRRQCARLSTEARDAITAHANGAELTEIVDNRLIGGAIIRIDNTRIDGSVTGALMRLKTRCTVTYNFELRTSNFEGNKQY